MLPCEPFIILLPDLRRRRHPFTGNDLAIYSLSSAVYYLPYTQQSSTVCSLTIDLYAELFTAEL